MSPAWGQRFYERLLAVLPNWFRTRYQQALIEAFRIQRRDPLYEGFWGALRFWKEMIADLVRTAYRLRIRGRDQAPSPPRRTPTGDFFVMNWIRDFRQSARTLLKSPAFSLVAVITLALGIGAATSIFSLVYSVLLRPLPYHDPDQLVLFWEYDPRYQYDHLPLSPAQYLDWKSGAESFTSMAGFRSSSVTLSGDEADPARLRAMIVDSDLFELLGVSPVRGRPLRAADCLQGAAPVVVIDHGLWQSRFAGDFGVLGKTIDIDARAHEIVGIMPAGMRFPPPVNLLGGLHEWNTQLYLPYAPDPEMRSSRSVYVVARLKPGVSIPQARQQLQPLADDMAARFSEIGEGMQPVLSPLREQAVQDSRGGLLMIFGAVGLLLLISCVNVANLQLARLPARAREIAVLAALGASRGQVFRRLLSESLLVAVAGSLLGIALAWSSLQWLTALVRDYLPDMGPVELSAPVLALSLLVGALTGIVFGIAPGIKALKLDLIRSLREGGRGASPAHQRLRAVLVMAQIAVAVFLCIGAGLLFNSFLKLQTIDPGFTAEGVTAVQFLLPRGRYPQPEQQERFADRALSELRSLPWIEQSAAANFLPLTQLNSAGHFVVEGQSVEEARQAQQLAEERVVSDGFFEVLRVPVLAGRPFRPDDNAQSRAVCMVNRRLAERLWPNQSPVGRRLAYAAGPEGNLHWMEIVGVAEGFKAGALESDDNMAIYQPLSQSPQGFFNVLLRTSRPWQDVSETVRSRVASIDPDLPLEVVPLPLLVELAQAPRRTPTVLMGLFAAVALVLAVVGLYGVLAFLVTQRTREIGLRMALGARRPDVLRLLTLTTGRLLLTGLALGLLSAALFSSTLSGLLYQVSPLSPGVYLSVALLFSFTAALACLAPALRALKINPAQTLRAE
ncbi:MAG TPA: ABC transporter permease [Acidobacteriota bacterium]|nr:ABC transporter permease [Acidobacteriota bacterium]